MDIKVEKMTLNDLENIQNILISDFDDFWNYNILKDELESENSIYIVAKSNKEIIGFAGIKILLDEADIMNIVTKKCYRNQGIGTLLLKNLISISRNLNLHSLSLEVNEENKTAIHLYENLGFKNIGIRKNYYKSKNGKIMALNLS